MENPPDQTESKEILIQPTRTRPKGGLLTMPFIIGNEAFEKVASYGLIQNMILYLMSDYGLGLVKGQNVLFMWVAASSFLPIVGGFISDSYLGRFLTIAIASLSSFLGMVVLWLTAMLPQVKPPLCVGASCSPAMATSSQLALLYSAFALISIGSGGIRPCSLAFGADQLDNKENLKNERVLESFFGWYYASSAVAVLIAFTVIVYIQDHLGWRIGFGIPAILMLFAGILFVFASPLYVKRNVTKSLFTGLAQVAVAAYVNRKLRLPSHNDSYGCYYHLKDSELKAPSDKLRFLNKACVIRNREEDIGADGLSVNPWRLCTTDQVEELKALVKVIPVWSTGIMMSINTSQNSFQLLQANTMDRRLSSNSSFQIPAGSFGMFTIIALIAWVVLYDRAILPLASKIRGRPVTVNVKIRMGFGLFMSFLAMAISATVEHYRRKTAINQGLANNASATVNMSAMWLVPQYVLHGLAEALTGIGQTEFFYTEFPKSMSSIAASLFGLGMAVANVLASVILNVVKNSSRKGNKSWIEDNINKGHYDYYYWVLAIMSFVNVIYYIMCSWSYGPIMDQVRNEKINDGVKEEDEDQVRNEKFNGVKEEEKEVKLN